MFRKKESPRVRQSIPNQRSSSQVFSYHASRSAGNSGSGVRKAGGLPWSASAKVSPRPKQRPPLFRRIPVILGALIAFVVVNSLVLSREPEVITLANTGNRHVFLRSQASYQSAAEAVLGRSFANTNKITIDTTSIAAELKRQFPELENVSVVLPLFGRKPVLYVQPARPVLLCKTMDGGVYVLDASGRALMNASQADGIERLGLQVVEDQSGLPVTLGSVLLPSDNVAFITEVIGQFKAKGFALSGVALPKGASQLDVRLDGLAYTVKFNLRGDARAEVGSYLAVKAYLEREHKTPGSYVDVRVDNRAYYQ